MNARWMFWIGFGLLIVVGLVMGGLGDKSIAVTYRNETDRPVTVYPYGHSYPAGQRALGAGGTFKDNLLASDTQPKTHIASVEAFDESGNLIYCHSFNYGELKGNGGLIDIRPGENAC